MPTTNMTVSNDYMGDSRVIHRMCTRGRSRFCAMKIAANATRMSATQSRSANLLARRTAEGGAVSSGDMATSCPQMTCSSAVTVVTPEPRHRQISGHPRRMPHPTPSQLAHRGNAAPDNYAPARRRVMAQAGYGYRPVYELISFERPPALLTSNCCR